MIRLHNISKSYIRSRRLELVLDQVDLTIAEGAIVGIRGKSGSGKSTLLNIIAAALKADSGAMFFRERDMQQASHKERAYYRSANIGYIPQNLYLLEDRDVYHNIALPLQYMKRGREQIKKEVTSLAEEFGIGHLLDKKIDTLSGGEKQRVAICRAIIKKPDIILADEPTASLDDDNEALVLRLFQVMKKQGCSIVIATHDDKISDICDQVYVIKDHQLVPMAY